MDVKRDALNRIRELTHHLDHTKERDKMTEEILVLVRVKVDNDSHKPVSCNQALSAVEAVRHAVKHMEGAGFVHPLAEEISISVNDVELISEEELDL